MLPSAKYRPMRLVVDAAHNDKKSRGGAVLWNSLSWEAGKIHGDVFLAHYYACKFGLNRLRIDGDIRQKPL